MIGTSYSTAPTRVSPNAVHPLGNLQSNDLKFLQANLTRPPSTSVGQQAGAGAIEGVGGFMGAVEQAINYNPLTPMGMKNVAQGFGRMVGLPQPPAPQAVGPQLAGQAVESMGIPNPQTMGQTVTREGVRGAVSALPFAMIGGALTAGNAVTAATSGAVGDIATSRADEVLGNLGVPDWARRPLAMAAGVLAGMGPGALKQRFMGDPTQKAAQRVERVTNPGSPMDAEPAPITSRDLTTPGQSGMEVLGKAIETPLAKALKVKPMDANERIASLDAEIAQHNEQVYGPAVGSTKASPPLVKAHKQGVSSRMVKVLEDPDVRDAVKGAWDDVNATPTDQPVFSPKMGGVAPQPRPQLDPIYDNAGRLTLTAQTKGIPIAVLDKARREFGNMVDKTRQTTSVQRGDRYQFTKQTDMLRSATDDELRSMGDTRLIQARAGTQRLETLREQTERGMNLLKEGGEDVRGQKVPQTPALLRAELKDLESGPNGKEAVQAFREGVFTAAKEQLTLHGSLSNDQLQRLMAVLPPGSDAQALVNAWRRGMMAGEIAAEAGTRAPMRQGEISKAELGAVELGTGIQRRGQAHIVQGLIHGNLTRGQQAAIQKFLTSPEGVEIFRKAIQAADATRTVRGVGAMAGAMSGTAPAPRQTAP